MRSLCKLVLEIWNHVPFALRQTDDGGIETWDGTGAGDEGLGWSCPWGGAAGRKLNCNRGGTGGTGNGHLKARLSKYNDIKSGPSFKGSLCQYDGAYLGICNRDRWSFDGAAIQDDPRDHPIPLLHLAAEGSSTVSSTKRHNCYRETALSDDWRVQESARRLWPDSRIIKSCDPNALQSNTHETSIWHVCVLLITIISV